MVSEYYLVVEVERDALESLIAEGQVVEVNGELRWIAENGYHFVKVREKEKPLLFGQSLVDALKLKI